MPNPFVTPALFRFLRELERNNERDWFNDHKQRYLDQVQEPLCAFVEAVGGRLRKIAPAVVADPRPNGGSLFRIYRDTRFSKDKRPYKTTAALQFPLAPKGTSAPGFYLSLAPGRVVIAAGFWRPDPAALRAIREAIASDPARWKRARRDGLDDHGDTLKRVPRGFDDDHPFADDLKHRSFSVSTPRSEKQACAPGFVTDFVGACRSHKPLVAFLGEAAGLRV